MPHIPIINLDPFLKGMNPKTVAREIAKACKEHGFFYIAGHGIELKLQNELAALSHQFFALSLDEKMKISMELGGKAWRGYFPVGNELTSGKPDLKEGIYFGQEHASDDERLRLGLPLHGKNQFPDHLPEFRDVILRYMKAMTQLGHHLMEALSISLGLDRFYFRDHYTQDPITLFRIFHYPPTIPSPEPEWGVGEHTDYGVLTILKQDEIGGLQVKSQGNWIEAPPLENTFVCNIGDMLDKLTGGIYQSTPHRVVNRSGKGRLSFPFFFDPNWNAEIAPVYAQGEQESNERWDGVDLSQFKGTYGEYLIGKVSKVFPDLI